MNVTAQIILDENNYTVTDISLINLEGVIDNSIGYLNLRTGLSMSALSGSAGSKTVTLTSQQASLVKMLTTLMVKAFVDRGPNASVGGLSVTSVISDPQYNLYMKLIEDGIAMLIITSTGATSGRVFLKTEV
jgi:hypothetical protein